MTSAKDTNRRPATRRDFLRAGTLSAGALALTPILGWQAAAAEIGSVVSGPANWMLPFDRD